MRMLPYHILLVEDERDILQHTQAQLAREGYAVSSAASCAGARQLLQQVQPDLIVLDIMLPDGSGLDLCRDLRGRTAVPVLFLTNLGEKSQVVQGLRAGADDYIVKPFDRGELIARIEALLRRTARSAADNGPPAAAALELDHREQRALWAGRDMVLSPKEYQILALLCRTRNRYTPAEELYSEIWGMSAGEDVRTVKVHISGLRRKLLATAKDGRIELLCQKGRGYRLQLDETAERSKA